MPPLNSKDAGPRALESGNSSPDWIAYWKQDQFWAQSKIWALNARLFLKKSAPFLNLSSVDKVLDIGCGPGFVAELLAPRVGQYLGLDTSETLLHKARPRCASLSNVSFERLPENYTRFEVSGKFSLFLCISVIQYYGSTDQVLQLVESVRNFALPGARLLLADIPQPRNIQEWLWDFLCSVGQSIGEGYVLDYLGTIVKWFFSDYRKISKTMPILEIPVEKLGSQISRLGLKATIIRPSVSVCANRPSLLVQF